MASNPKVKPKAVVDVGGDPSKQQLHRKTMSTDSIQYLSNESIGGKNLSSQPTFKLPSSHMNKETNHKSIKGGAATHRAASITPSE